MLKALEGVSDQIDVKVEQGLFDEPNDPLRVLAERLAEAILAEPGLPLKAIRVAKADLPEEDEEDDKCEIGFYLKLACGPKQAFQWLERLSYRQYEIDRSLPEEERLQFAHTFRIVTQWEKRQ